MRNLCLARMRLISASLGVMKRAPRASLDRVGALSDVKVDARTVRADSRLGQLGARLALRPGAPDVAVLSRQDIVLLKPRLAVRNVRDFTRRLTTAVALFLGAFWMAHLFRRWRRRDDDPLLLPVLLLLCGIGLMTMCALRDPVRDTIAAELFAAGAAMGIAKILFFVFLVLFVVSLVMHLVRGRGIGPGPL